MFLFIDGPALVCGWVNLSILWPHALLHTKLKCPPPRLSGLLYKQLDRVEMNAIGRLYMQLSLVILMAILKHRDMLLTYLEHSRLRLLIILKLATNRKIDYTQIAKIWLVELWMVKFKIAYLAQFSTDRFEQSWSSSKSKSLKTVFVLLIMQMPIPFLGHMVHQNC